MEAAAVAGRVSLLPRARTRRVAARALAFDELGGPLVGVCGLAGGAGTSSLALTLARRAAATSSAPVLVTEADPAHGGLAALARAASPFALAELAQRLADDAAPAETFVDLEPGLRLVAAGPRRCAPVSADALRLLLGEARAAHGLVIVDCGTTWAADSAALSRATHVLWTMPATPAGLARADAVLNSSVMPAAGRAIEALVATAHSGRPTASVRALRRLAGARCDRLILVPHSEAAARGEPDEPILRALTGLASILRGDR